MDSLRRGKYVHSKGIGLTVKAMAVAVFAFMVGSQIVSYGGPGTVLGSMFPSTAFGSKISSSSASSTASQQNSSSSIGTPLPPGSVNYVNTWNQTQIPCSRTSNATSQALIQTTANNWTLRTAVPSVIFENKAVGPTINQTYRIFQNGTTLLNDSSGNSYSWSLLESLPPGITHSTMSTNSSEAIQNITLASAGGKNIGKLSVVYSLAQKSCNQAGLEVTILGSVNWHPNGTGKVTFHFNKAPIKLSETTAYFGNNSGTLTGLNWTDLKSPLKPSFIKSNNSLIYSVGNNFTIDPTTLT